MKKIVFSFLLILLTIGNVRSQFTVLDVNENEIENNQEFTFNTVDSEEGKLHFYIRNDTDEAIKIEGKVLRVDGSDGSLANFCLGQCLPTAQVGDFVPDNGEGYEISPNATDNSPGIYFLNLDDSNDYIEYKFQIYQIDNSGNQIGDAVNMVYIYDSTLSTSTEKLAQMGVDIENTIASEEIKLQTNESVAAAIYDLNGKKVLEKSLQNGNQSINISMLNAGVYLIRFNNQFGSTATAKIIKK